MRQFFYAVIVFSCIFHCHAHNPEYYIGYAQAIMEDFSLSEKSEIFLEGNDLKIKIYGEPLTLQSERKFRQRLEKLKYFKTINLVYIEPKAALTDASGQNGNTLPSTVPSNMEFLPSGAIYDAPIADPKWPNFSVGYQRHYDKTYGKNIFGLSFGDNLALFRQKKENTTYEWGIQANLSGLIDFSKAPSKLINSDYFVGAGLSILHNDYWQNMIQFSHLSSHLGDEILLSNKNLARNRVNLSYEALKWYTAYKFKTLRPYLGVGYMVDRDPSSLKPLILEAGMDYISTDTFFMNIGRFVVGVHTHFWQTNSFKPSLNIRPGIQFENARGNGRNLKLLFDYSYGNSRHGQFYEKKEQYIGVLISITS